MMGTSPLRQHLVLAMQGRGTMLTKAIYCAVKEHCDGMNRPLPSNWQSDIRQILQAQCASRPQYKGGANIFIYHRRGHWSCTAEPTSTSPFNGVQPAFYSGKDAVFYQCTKCGNETTERIPTGKDRWEGVK
jgi:hypothetical protein